MTLHVTLKRNDFTYLQEKFNTQCLKHGKIKKKKKKPKCPRESIIWM